MIQRSLDCLLSGIALLVLAPLFIVVILILRMSGEGEVFYRQTRIGRGGAPFRLLKFATMLKNSPQMGTGTLTIKDDPRVLPVGRFLRRTKINELPQLLNIIRGDMSLIGPRPQTARCFNAFPLSAQRAIIRVRPGLSGIGSIVFRAEEEILRGSLDPDQAYDTQIMPFKGALEEWYVRNQGLRTYALLIVLTLRVLLDPRSSGSWRFFPDLPRPPAPLAPFLNAGDDSHDPERALKVSGPLRQGK